MSRHLTQGEIALAKKIFGDSLNYGEVLIHQSKYPLTLYLQPNDKPLTPNGEIYAPEEAYLEDYSLSNSKYSPINKSIFLHELMHVWQYQNKVYGDLRGRAFYELITHGFDYSSSYTFKLIDGKDLLDYNMEQQASIIELYYLLRFEGWSIKDFRVDEDYAWRIENMQDHYTVMKLFQSVLRKFMEDPNYAKHKYRFW